MPLTIHNLLDLLKKQNLDAQIQEETNQVYTTLKINENEYPIFGRVFEGGELVQLIAFIPTQIESKAIPDLARLLHFFNRELDIPGFGMDEMAAVAFYRCMIPTVEGNLDEKVLTSFLQAIKTACEFFGQAVEVMATGSAKFDEILEKAKAESHPK